ncbi:30S ribosomal protein S8 [Candidatus Gottesmanbacteria bacterium]|nr:30S ribosomal protein S8 [Candidatus Gottesmanbacteria bacterium]
MMVNDPVGDMLAQIKNASMARKGVVVLPHSRMKQTVAELLAKEGYVEGVEVTGEAPKRYLTIRIKYENEMPVIGGMKRVSKPGLRWYVDHGKIPTVVGGLGIAIVSTSSGIMTGKEAKKRGIGGELLCTVW